MRATRMAAAWLSALIPCLACGGGGGPARPLTEEEAAQQTEVAERIRAAAEATASGEPAVTVEELDDEIETVRGWEPLPTDDGSAEWGAFFATERDGECLTIDVSAVGDGSDWLPEASTLVPAGWSVVEECEGDLLDPFVMCMRSTERQRPGGSIATSTTRYYLTIDAYLESERIETECMARPRERGVRLQRDPSFETRISADSRFQSLLAQRIAGRDPDRRCRPRSPLFTEANGLRVSREDFGPAWPFTTDSVCIHCEGDTTVLSSGQRLYWMSGTPDPTLLPVGQLRARSDTGLVDMRGFDEVADAHCGN